MFPYRLSSSIVKFVIVMVLNSLGFPSKRRVFELLTLSEKKNLSLHDESAITPSYAFPYPPVKKRARKMLCRQVLQ